MSDKFSIARQARQRRVAYVDVPCPICGVLPGDHDPESGVIEGHHVLCGLGSGVLPEELVRAMMPFLDEPDALITLAVELRAAADTWTVALPDLGEDVP